MSWTITALYRFVTLDDLPKLQTALKEICARADMCGTLLIAPEGINGTIAAPSEEKMEQALTEMDALTGLMQGEVKYSAAEEKPFRRMKVRLKREIVTLRQPEADPSKVVGTYVTPDRWNDVISDPNTIVLDTRNTYETAVGMFKGAIDPQTQVFTEFVDYVRQNLDPKTHKKVAMYCTGGIRCEKASAFMLKEGFEEVFHLKGGILKYLEEVKPQESLWDGACFVFDRRVAVDHSLAPSAHMICYGCRFPLSEADTQSQAYEEGVSCPHCIDNLTEEKARAFRMRHAQMQKLQEQGEIAS
jgi:UPF0176 protein